MAIRTLQSFDPAFRGADFSSTDRYTCRILVPFAHKLITAKLYFQKTVTTGTVTVTLKQADVGDGRGGAIVGTALNNTDLGDVTDTNTKIDFVLAVSDKLIAGAHRTYFLVITATNSADRVDEPMLVIEVNDSP